MELPVLVICLAFLFFSQPVLAATVEGKIISWENLSPLTGAVIEFNSTPKQRIITEGGIYRISLPPGNYTLQAVYYQDNVPVLYALEQVKISEEGNFVFDIVLFPITEADLNRLSVFQTAKREKSPFTFSGIIIPILVLLVISASLFFVLVSRKRPEQPLPADARPEEESVALPPVQGTENLDKYAQECIQVLSRSGNRLTQKELREKTSIGEAKVSLVIAELEQMGYVKKIKQGRGNIIVLQGKNQKNH